MKAVESYLKVFGKTASIVENGTVYDNVGYIDTGCYMLNAQLSGSIYKGIRSNKITGLAGAESTGKTFLLLGIIRNFLNVNENSLVVYFESEGAVDKNMFISRNIDISRVIFVPVETVEHLRTEAVRFLNKYKSDDDPDKPKVLMCLDSLGMLPSEKENESAQDGDNKVDMTRAKMIKSLFRTITNKLAINNIPFIFINHVYSKMEKYALPEFSGGSGSKMSASTLLYLTKSNYKEVNKDTENVENFGISVTSHIIKSRETREKSKVNFVIHIKKGLEKYSGIFDFCVEHGLIKKIGKRWYWASEGEDSAMYKKVILEDLEGYFSKNNRLDEVNKYTEKYFGFGHEKDIDNSNSEEDVEKIINEIEGVEMTKDKKDDVPKKRGRRTKR